MNERLSPQKSGTLRTQISLRVLILSLIAVVGLLAEIIVGLNASIQGARRQLVGEADSAALAFTKSLSIIETDLRSTSAALTYAEDENQVLRALLERQPALFEVLVVTPQGSVSAKRRRVGEAPSRVNEQPWLGTIREGKMYMGLVDYSQFGVPFVDLAVAVYNRSGDFAGTLLARTDFTALWNPVITLRIGETGHSYILHSDGQILAYRNQELVRKGASFPAITGKTPATVAESPLNIFRGIEGNYVIAAATPVPNSPWYIVVEQEVSEALFTFGILTLALFVLLGLVLWQAISAVSFTRRRVVAPLGKLQTAVEEIQRGNLATRITVDTQDELGSLAQTVNEMATQIQEFIGSLEQRVAERTVELEVANQANAARALRLKAIAEVSRTISSIQDTKTLLFEIARQISETFGHYHVGIFLLDPSGEYAILSASNSPGGQKMLARGHRLKVGQTGIVGFVTATGKPRIALNVGEDAVFFNNPDLPETRSEIALPLRVGNVNIGALDVQSTQANAFTEDDTETLSILADQVAIAIQNARLFEDTRRALSEADALQRQYVQQKWSQLLKASKEIGYRYAATGAEPLDSPLPWPEIQQAMQADGPVKVPEAGSHASLAVPLKLRGETIGVLNVRMPGKHFWDEDEVDVAQAVADRVALAIENARLLNETSRSAAKERTIGELSAKISASIDLEQILHTTVEELGRLIPGSEVVVQFQTEEKG